MESDYCLRCKHYLSSGTCEAYEEKIPKEIFVGEVEHDSPRPDQENNIVFEPLDN